MYKYIYCQVVPPVTSILKATLAVAADADGGAEAPAHADDEVRTRARS